MGAIKSDAKCESEAIADVLLAQTCCFPITRLSCEDLHSECMNDRRVKADTHAEARVLEGYGKLIEWYKRVDLVSKQHFKTRKDTYIYIL